MVIHYRKVLQIHVGGGSLALCLHAMENVSLDNYIESSYTETLSLMLFPPFCNRVMVEVQTLWELRDLRFVNLWSVTVFLLPIQVHVSFTVSSVSLSLSLLHAYTHVHTHEHTHERMHAMHTCI